MDLLQTNDSVNVNNGLTLNLDALSTDSFPPLTFLADASLWFEEQNRRPSEISAGFDTVTLTANTSFPIQHDANDISLLPHYTELRSDTEQACGSAMCMDADRLEVARIMEQLKKGWDGTSAPHNADDTIQNLSRLDAISCRLENDKLTVDLRPLFTDTLHKNICKSANKTNLPLFLQFPFGTVSLNIPVGKLWGTNEHAKKDIIVSSEQNEFVDENNVRKWKCHLCPDKIYANANSLKAHFLVHSGFRPYACPVCQKTFGQMGHLSTHMLLHRDARRFACGKCGQRFVQKHHLLRHNATCCAGARRSVCTECMQGVCKLGRHNNAVHKSVRAHICTECGAEFKLSHHLKTHMNVHSAFKTHQCTLCFATFKLRAHLTRHTATVHSDPATDSPFHCSVCQKRFKRADTLKDHMLIHADDPHKLGCDVCGAKFRKQSRLREHHQLKHSTGPVGNKHICPNCSRAFNRQSNLNRHLIGCRISINNK